MTIFLQKKKIQYSISFSQKKSRDESKGAGSGVEIIINEPYEDGPGGKGQYTRKIYHVGSHLPGWIKGEQFSFQLQNFLFYASQIQYI